jgi:L-amino acid N-acyltransferase YncA
MPAAVDVREARSSDLSRIREIYNQGIADRIATLDEEEKSDGDISDWWAAHGERYFVLVAERGGDVVGWASANPYSHRCAYRGVADLSIYVAREARGTGVGGALLGMLEGRARAADFHKIVLFTLLFNQAGQRLYRAHGFREVGVFREQGFLDGRPVDVMVMEKLLL